MTDKVFVDENKTYEFNFQKASFATNRLNEIYHNNKVSLADVDFIFKFEDQVYFVEYKNANLKNAAKPEAFVPSSQNKIDSIVRKFYGSLIYLWACGEIAPAHYVYILEYPLGDVVTRKMLRNKIISLLPIEFQQQPFIKNKLIQDFEVLSIDEWNSHAVYSVFPINEVTESIA